MRNFVAQALNPITPDLPHMVTRQDWFDGQYGFSV
jgi:hypothetical protein